MTFKTSTVILLITCIYSYVVLAKDHPRWMHTMKEVVYSHSILDLTLPGSHDSGGYELQLEIAPGIPKELVEIIDFIKDSGIYPIEEFISAWSQTQGIPIYNQLVAGVRYIDLRVVWKKDCWYSAHFLLGLPIQGMLDDISRFMEENPGEVVILELGNFADSHTEEHKLLLGMINQTLGQYLAPIYPNGLSSITVGEMVARNERLVVMLPNYIDIAKVPNITEHYKFMYFAEDIEEGEYANSDKVEVMEEWNKGLIYTLGGGAKLMSLSWTLTVQVEVIERAVLDPLWQIKSLRDMAHSAHIHLPAFNKKYYNYQLGNLLLADWFDQSDIVEIALQRNARNCHNSERYSAISKDGHDCRSWALAGKCDDEATALFMSRHCQLSCGLC